MDKRLLLLNKAALARELGVTRQLVWKWFATDQAVPRKWRRKVSKATGIPEKAL
jgi:hypothetical protein